MCSQNSWRDYSMQKMDRKQIWFQNPAFLSMEGKCASLTNVLLDVWCSVALSLQQEVPSCCLHSSVGNSKRTNIQVEKQTSKTPPVGTFGFIYGLLTWMWFLHLHYNRILIHFQLPVKVDLKAKTKVMVKTTHNLHSILLFYIILKFDI